MTTDFAPTAEQQAALDLFAKGESMVIIARAGAGKTSTLRLIAESTDRAGRYLAYNKAIAHEVAGTLPRNCAGSTAHALAFRALGHRYERRLNAPRMRGWEIAERLDVPRLSLRVGDGFIKVLSEGYLAGVVIKAIEQFCRTADDAPSRHHVQYIDGIDFPDDDGSRRYENNNRVAAELEPCIQRAWADIQRLDGGLPYKHDYYLKAWQLTHPQTAASFIMLDECQPTGTMVTRVTGRSKVGRGGRTQHEQVRIEDLAVGDMVVAMQPGCGLKRGGCRVSGISTRPFRGDLIVAKTASGRVTRYTPNHHCIARIGDAFTGRHLVYVMRRGNDWRVGVTTGVHGKRPGRVTGPKGRLQEERADAMWVLRVFDSRTEALLYESGISARYNLPEVTFRASGNGASQADLDAFWAEFGGNPVRARDCLADHGRDERYPLADRKSGYLLYGRGTVVHACNLMDGMALHDSAAMLAAGDRNSVGSEHWSRITLTREPYIGQVWSLTVDDHHTYIADGIATHNCQDANPVIAAIIEEQTHAQRVMVGDPEQEIYGWAGAVNALDKFDDGGNRTCLTQTFRFGDLVAEEANKILRRLNAEPLVRGHAPIASTVGPLGEDDRPDVVLCRSNAGAVNVVLDAQRHGVRAALVGGGKQVVSFAEGAQRLMNGEQSWHPDLSCFDTWQQVCDYVSQDAQGRDLKLLVDLVEEFGPETIIDALGKMPDESRCDLVASTAHKAKGRQWSVVQLHTDFAPADDRDPSESELRLQYVAVTRAQQHLDCTVLDRPAPARTLTVVDGEADSTEGDRPEVRQIRSGTF